jgi:hypothetical protein
MGKTENRIDNCGTTHFPTKQINKGYYLFDFRKPKNLTSYGIRYLMKFQFRFLFKKYL